jgi:hypothetical protein
MSYKIHTSPANGSMLPLRPGGGVVIGLLVGYLLYDHGRCGNNITHFRKGVKPVSNKIRIFEC